MTGEGTTESQAVGGVLTKTLPPETKVGTEITFTNTILSNTEEFEPIILMRLAQVHNLDPADNYEEITRMAQNPDVVNPIKEQLQQESKRSYIVTEEITPPGLEEKPEPKLDCNHKFFERFDYLPDNGVSEVPVEEFLGAEKVYIGGGLNTSAFANMKRQYLYGDSEDNPTYFSTDYEVAMTHMLDEEKGVKPVLVEVSLPRLLEQRRIFRDPESFYIKKESGKTFIAFHGIPTCVIERVLVLKELV